MTPSHAALLAAVELLPSNGDDFDVGAKTLASASLSDDESTAKAFLRNFAAWARAYAPTVPDITVFEATDYQDYYKLVMSRVQYIYARCTDDVADGPLATFQTHLRRNPQFTSPTGDTRTLCVLDLEPNTTPAPAGCYTQVDANFREALAAVGARRFRAQTLRQLLASRCTKAGLIEDSLGGMTEDWIAALDGTRLFTLLSPGEDFTNGKRCEVKIVIYHGHAVVLARGPWWRVTFVETTVLQCICQFMTDELNARSEDGAVGWHSEALASFALWAHQVERKVHGPKRATVTLFSGRRAPSPCFHLLQHMYLSTLWGQGFATSSCLAARVLAPLGRPQELHGTSAHEGPMAFMALCSELDSTVPVSSMLWTILFWAATSNTSVLPDTFGSATFKQMLSDVGLLDEVSAARQDSGRLDRFKEIFAPFPCMASEVGKFSDIEDGMALGYVGFGVGGALGERRRENKEMSIVMKLVEVVRVDRATGAPLVTFAGKLGDCSAGGGSWARYDEREDGGKARGKFITSMGADGVAMWERLFRWASAGDRQHDAGVSAALVPRADALALAVAVRRIASAAWLCQPHHAHIRAAMCKYAMMVDRAAIALVPAPSPGTPEAAPVREPLEESAGRGVGGGPEEEEEWVARADGSFRRASDAPPTKDAAVDSPELSLPVTALSYVRVGRLWETIESVGPCTSQQPSPQKSLLKRRSRHVSEPLSTDEESLSCAVGAFPEAVEAPLLSPLTHAERSWLATEVASLAVPSPSEQVQDAESPRLPQPHLSPQRSPPPPMEPHLAAAGIASSPLLVSAVSPELQRSYHAFMERAHAFASLTQPIRLPAASAAPVFAGAAPAATHGAVADSATNGGAADAPAADSAPHSGATSEPHIRSSVGAFPIDAESLASYETYLIGCDGVLWGVARLTADRAVETVNALLAMGKRILFVTNDSSLTRKACVARLERLRVRFGGRRLSDRLAMCITSAHTTALYLKARGLRHPFVVASDSAVLEELRAVGIDQYHATVLDSGEPRREFVSGRQDAGALSRIVACPWVRRVDCVVVTSDGGFSARKVAAAVNILAMADEAGKPPLPLMACSSDRSVVMGTYNGKSGLPLKLRAMGNGSMAESVSRCFEPPRGWLDLGKPSDALLELVTHGYRVDACRALVVGDGLATDVVFGNKGRMATLLVLSGITTRAQVDEALACAHALHTPTYILPELGTYAKELAAMARASGA